MRGEGHVRAFYIKSSSSLKMSIKLRRKSTNKSHLCGEDEEGLREGAVRSLESESFLLFEAEGSNAGLHTDEPVPHTALLPFPRPSLSTSKTKRAFHRGGGGVGGAGSNDEEGELDGDEGRARHVDEGAAVSFGGL